MPKTKTERTSEGKKAELIFICFLSRDFLLYRSNHKPPTFAC